MSVDELYFRETFFLFLLLV